MFFLKRQNHLLYKSSKQGCNQIFLTIKSPKLDILCSIRFLFTYDITNSRFTTLLSIKTCYYRPVHPNLENRDQKSFKFCFQEDLKMRPSLKKILV